MPEKDPVEEKVNAAFSTIGIFIGVVLVGICLFASYVK